MTRDVFDHRSAIAPVDLESAAGAGIEPVRAIPAILETALTGSSWELVGITHVEPEPEDGSYGATVSFIVRRREPTIHAIARRWFTWDAEMTQEAALSILSSVGLSWADGLTYAEEEA